MTFDRLAYQREYRRKNDNIHTKVYEKTVSGFLMRLYRNMESRITGIQKEKFHLYEGRFLIPRDTFYEWSNKNEKFQTLYKDYVVSGYDRKLAPSVDRIDSSKGYELDNIEWVTMSENSRRGALSRHNKQKENIND